MEPKTCEYVLGVESPLVCDILASADEYGLMKVSSKSDFTTATTTPSSAGDLVLLCLKKIVELHIKICIFGACFAHGYCSN